MVALHDINWVVFFSVLNNRPRGRKQKMSILFLRKLERPFYITRIEVLFSCILGWLPSQKESKSLENFQANSTSLFAFLGITD